MLLMNCLSHKLDSPNILAKYVISPNFDGDWARLNFPPVVIFVYPATAVAACPAAHLVRPPRAPAWDKKRHWGVAKW
jgi:hypothetical protein